MHSDTLQREIADLHKEMNRLQKGYEEASQAALKDEISAVEMQREASISQVEEWLASAQRYLDMLRRSDASHQNMQRRLEWEKKVAAARSSLGNLQRSFNEQLQFLRQGEQLDSLVPVTLPSLPHIPSLEFQMGFPASFAPMHMPPVFIPSPAIVLQPHFPSAATNSSHARSNSKSGTPAHQPVASTVPHTTLLNKLNTPSRPLSPAKPAPVAQPASAPADTAQPAGLLDKLLEKLGARFPHCSRNQLMSALQQIKSARGTMAGLSIEDLTQQVAQRLAQTEKPALGPIGPLQHAQRPARPTQGSAAAHVFDIRTSQNVTSNSRKLCLMCQNQVEAGTQHSMSCSHIVHKEFSDLSHHIASSEPLVLYGIAGSRGITRQHGMRLEGTHPGRNASPSQGTLSGTRTRDPPESRTRAKPKPLRPLTLVMSSVNSKCISLWLQSSKNNSCPFCPSK
ncbi:hypothetical protein Z043_104261 [Scleropages formosus]|uniref:RING finger protein 214-like n=1 Tax=Scleropages formosus TaxID=113540 RepID=A0A0P7V188_SCLFO|nr:hypothetical protein Z043_104261 [Scleropages formosus]